MIVDISGANRCLEAMAHDKFQWFPQLGVGYIEVQHPQYDQVYFDNYRRLASTDIGKRLNAFRVEIVETYASVSCPVLDVGVGAGSFIDAYMRAGRRNVAGYDVNPAGVAWLASRGIFRDLYDGDWPCATFWDSLEHIRDPALALAHVSRTAVISLPIFKGCDHALGSKHFKPSEHYWYFTHEGFTRFAVGQGFDVIFWTNRESLIGREDIETFVLKRRSAAHVAHHPV